MGQERASVKERVTGGCVRRPGWPCMVAVPARAGAARRCRPAATMTIAARPRRRLAAYSLSAHRRRCTSLRSLRYSKSPLVWRKSSPLRTRFSLNPTLHWAGLGEGLGPPPCAHCE